MKTILPNLDTVDNRLMHYWEPFKTHITLKSHSLHSLVDKITYYLNKSGTLVGDTYEQNNTYYQIMYVQQYRLVNTTEKKYSVRVDRLKVYDMLKEARSPKTIELHTQLDNYIKEIRNLIISTQSRPQRELYDEYLYIHNPDHTMGLYGISVDTRDDWSISDEVVAEVLKDESKIQELVASEESYVHAQLKGIRGCYRAIKSQIAPEEYKEKYIAPKNKPENKPEEQEKQIVEQYNGLPLFIAVVATMALIGVLTCTKF